MSVDGRRGDKGKENDSGDINSINIQVVYECIYSYAPYSVKNFHVI